jgi:hypothetical protein
MRLRWPIQRHIWKNKEATFLIKQTLNDKNENKINKKTLQNKKKTIKRIMTKFDIEIKWKKNVLLKIKSNKMFRDEIVKNKFIKKIIKKIAIKIIKPNLT